jgi:hypothetical protein
MALQWYMITPGEYCQFLEPADLIIESIMMKCLVTLLRRHAFHCATQM